MGEWRNTTWQHGAVPVLLFVCACWFFKTETRMAKAPSRLCSKPGCKGIIRDNTCSLCGSVRRGWQADTDRGTRQQRGYDAAWTRLRNAFVQQQRLESMQAGIGINPLCAICGVAVRDWELHVDHIRPFNGADDPLRLDPSNLQVTHARCNLSKAAKTRGQGGSKGI